MGPAGPIDVNHEAIHRAMELYEIKDKRACFEKVLVMAQNWMDKARENNG